MSYCPFPEFFKDILCKLEEQLLWKKNPAKYNCFARKLTDKIEKVLTL